MGLQVRQEQLDGLVAFVMVAEERGFSAAAIRLGMTPSAVSQSIRGLEHRVGYPLFNRTTRSVGLTELGARYLERVRPCVMEIVQATEDLSEEADQPFGLLKLVVSSAAYRIALRPILRGFLEEHPQIKVELAFDSRTIDLVERGYDAGVTFESFIERDMIAARIGPPRSVYVVATPGYLTQRGVPEHPMELVQHSCLALRQMQTQQIERWEFSKGEEALDIPVAGQLTVDDPDALVQCALDGMGVAYVLNGSPEHLVDAGRLVRLLADWSPPAADIRLYYPGRQRAPAKLRALIDFIRQPQNPAQDRSDDVAPLWEPAGPDLASRRFRAQ